MGDETQAGPEEQRPRDRSKGRMRQVTKYPLWKIAAIQNNLNGRLSPFGLGRASRVRRRGYFCSVRKSGPILLDGSLFANGTYQTSRSVRDMTAMGAITDVGLGARHLTMRVGASLSEQATQPSRFGAATNSTVIF